jgi:hypothetical protein
MRKSDKQLTPNLRRHIFQRDVDVSGDTSTCPNTRVRTSADSGWLGALAQTALFMGIFIDRAGDFQRTGSIPQQQPSSCKSQRFGRAAE